MEQITADQTMSERLRQAKAFAEIKDPEGKYLGMFTPGTPEEVRLYLHAWFTLDPKEVEKQLTSNEPSFPYSEVKKRLESMEQK